MRHMMAKKKGSDPVSNEKRIPANHPALQYMGRIDWEDPENPVWIYACTCLRVRFTGSFVRAEVTNFRGCWDNYLGVILDGVQTKIKLAPQGREILTLGEDLKDGKHELLLFKRMDSCHVVQLHGLIFAENAVISAPDPLPDRKIEVYGDSVSAGEVSEAVDFCGQVDPPHNGELSNSYWSYSWCTARRLNAQLHDIAQGGAALMADTGWFHGPDYQGMEEIYDKLQYNDQITPTKPWDFSRYVPDVVIVAIGQNDSHPDDYMARDPQGEKAENWKNHYRTFVRTLRETYPKAHIILATTILNHHPGWDDAIDQVWRSLGDEKIHHFLYSNNGSGTHGHIRIPEAEKMADELSAFIQALPEIWG